MKRFFAAALVICLCIGLCACGKSAVVQKADELILAIGEVSLEKEPAILAAKAYYDTLNNGEKAQVENAAVLENAVAVLNTLKAESEYEKIYQKALEYEKYLLMDHAYHEYKKLPADYEDVTERIDKIAPYVGVTGTWVCDNYTATSNKGYEYGAIFETIILECRIWSGGRIGIAYSGSKAPPEYVNRSIVVSAGYQEMLWMIDSGGLAGNVQEENGARNLGYNLVAMTGFGQLVTTFKITSENKMLVEYSRKNNNDITTVTFVYSKQQ